MRTFSLAIVVLGLTIAGCDKPPPTLEEGKWTGTIIPMAQPDQRSEVYYRVSYESQDLRILIGTSDTEARPVRAIQLTTDSLRFIFNEPEADVEVSCSFGLQSNGVYEGPCSDAAGKSAHFSMTPPDPFGGQEA